LNYVTRKQNTNQEKMQSHYNAVTQLITGNLESLSVRQQSSPFQIFKSIPGCKD